MLSVADAFSIVLNQSLMLSSETVPLEQAVGRVLREDLKADRDFPPFDRVAMDGIAIQSGQFARGQRTFRLAGIQRAGQPRQTLTDSTACLEAMTGAVLPIGTDAVIRYEDLTIADGQATITIEGVLPGRSVHRQATDRQTGDVLVRAGTKLRPAEIAVAATIGQTALLVTALPRIALVSTGDELVPIGQTPLPHQIRRSNTYALRAALQAFGIDATLHHLNDDPAQLAGGLTDLLATNDLLILSGGVSAGKADFVPDVLASLGVKRLFHKVEQRPGKPLWFGVSPEGKPVFALPGNPVSTVVCYTRYIRPFLQASLGGIPLGGTPLDGTPGGSYLAGRAFYAQLTESVSFTPPVTYFMPVWLEDTTDGIQLAHPLPGSGSGDFANLTLADGFMEFPAERSAFAPGERFRVWPLI